MAVNMLYNPVELLDYYTLIVLHLEYDAFLSDFVFAYLIATDKRQTGCVLMYL